MKASELRDLRSRSWAKARELQDEIFNAGAHAAGWLEDAARIGRRGWPRRDGAARSAAQA